ncbi:MAG: HAMP domain-containing protein, partial [Thalassospira sp.]|nr:HAMP domain-containing protein [Thalassospira sp.]
KPASFMWATPDGRPVFSLILPVGGFRAVGFLEVITDPLPQLAGIGKVLGGNFQILDNSGNVLFESLEAPAEAEAETAPTAEGDAAPENGGDATPEASNDTPAPETAKAGDTHRAAVEVMISDGRGGVWAEARFDRDVSDFYAQTDSLRLLSIEILVGVLLAAWIVGWILLRTTVLRNLRAFAGAMTSISNGDTNVNLPNVGNDEIGEMKKALIALRESVRQALILQNMVENTPTMTAMILPDGKLSYLNASAQDYLGGTTATISGDFLNLGSDFQAKLANPNNLPFTEIIQTDRGYLDILAAPVRDKDNVLLGTMLAWNDVSEREESKIAVTELMAEVARVAQSVTEQSEGLLSLASELTNQSENTVQQSGG